MIAVNIFGNNIRTLNLFAGIIFAAFATFPLTTSAMADTGIPAKQLFGNKTLPAAMKPKVHGYYTKGCLSGAKAVPVDGPNWQTMRLSRNRRWGHPDLVRIIEDLSIDAASAGWNGLLVGDMSQPRGGPMLSGHFSHQVGLDADIWFTPMPDKRMTYKERETISAVSVLIPGSFYVDDQRWTSAHTNLLKFAAKYPEVERILVHPGIKKKLCDTIKGDRGWLRKIRPVKRGHHYHFHLRIGCPPGSPGCKSQNATPRSIGCDKTLAWWFKSGLIKKKKKKPAKKKKAAKPRYTKLGDLPGACEAVLNAPSSNLDVATHKIRTANFTAPNINIPAFNARRVLNSKPIEAKETLKRSASGGGTTADIPIPTKRPKS